MRSPSTSGTMSSTAQIDQQRAAIRSTHGLSLIPAEEDGTGAHRISPGHYGFCYVPVLKDSPAFRNFPPSAYEIQKRKDGSVYILGFATEAEAKSLESSLEPFDLHLRAKPTEPANQLVEVPAVRILESKPHSARESGDLWMRVDGIH